MVRYILALVVVAFLAPMAAPVFAQSGDETFVVAQQQKRKTLFDLLFGPKEPEAPPAPVEPARTTSTPSVTVLAPATPKIEKAEGSTRLAVFGDSMAVDLARALERTFAEDPNLAILEQGVGSSGFVRDDFFDWNAAIEERIAEDSFDLAVVIIGINDRQPIGNDKPLTDAWKTEYSARIGNFLGQMRAANKPVIWVGLPPMQASSYSAAMSQISSVQKLASFSGGAEFVDIYERFIDENGNYSSYGPDLNGQNALMRKSDGIHLSAAGADKTAFYVEQALKRFYRGGSVSIEVADLLDGTDAQGMVRLPFQGLGQIRLLEIAGAVLPLTGTTQRSAELVLATTPEESATPGFSLDMLVNAPVGRADAFGVGVEPGGAPPANEAR